MLAGNSDLEIQVRLRELADILEKMPVGLVIAEADSGNLFFHNDEAAHLLGHPGLPGPGADGRHYGAIHPDGTPYPAAEYPLARALRGEIVHPEEMLYIRGDGTNALFLINAVPLRDHDGMIVKAVTTFYDISGAKKVALRLQETETRLRLAVEIAQLGLWSWDVQTNAVYFSPEWKRQLGYQDQEIVNRFEEWESRVHMADLPAVRDRVQACLSEPYNDFAAEFRMRHRDGSYRWIQARAQLLRNDHGHGLRMTGTHLDITEHKEREEQVRQVGQHDRLTGLPNRALVLESAERRLSAARRAGKLFAVLFVDLDEFKSINDTYGHHIGDDVLKQVASRLKASFRSHDIVGRLGGDEFLVIVTQLDNMQDASRATEHALRALSEPYRIGDLSLHTSPSIGISLFPEHGSDIGTLVRNADAAMYDAKQGGKAGYRVFAADQPGVAASARIENRLRESVEDGGFQLYFQPIVDTRARRLIAVEALLRWPTGQGTAALPAVFIPIAEQNGLILKLGEWVLREACVQHRHWLGEGLPAIPIGINLSLAQFREADLPGAILRGIEEIDIDPGCLSVEISDRAFSGNLRNAATILNKLKSLGIRITLDNFGAGSLSLEQLSRLPIDRVKIDRSLIKSLPADKTSIAVTEAVITFSNALGIEVVAEGLESEQVLDFLQARHCPRAQGFYLAMPMPGAEFTQWYRQASLH
jgi:diguanylate cyclase (GGDEF)-like protein/PAS domain S-box-containing protein